MLAERLDRVKATKQRERDGWPSDDEHEPTAGPEIEVQPLETSI